ncbi:ankyrin repeat domain-containing protein [Sphingobacterium sp. SRCM116780]|uniref:ankyrin repeat domain-containing protein n=1 Tax=Sphingobacterium sp. SRCM116780 TaxID=2907623 RepID=UPI001F1AE8E0|nr:ankyrin repeat domain-containing protein [Sphingobacterium sp. SRCM116780]UIR55671.1 ankyrin repeat domain-containing protein [Sphingobacterium sp. SRCM116780]
MIKLIPKAHKQPLLSAIAKGDFDSIKNIIEQNKIDINAYDDYSYSPILMEVLTPYGIKNEDDRLKILRYFLEKGADPNLNCKSGYNCLHIAVQQEKLVKALDLFLDFGGDVNSADSNGGTVAYWAIQSFPWRTAGEQRQVHLKVLEKIFMLGADLDHKNKFGVTPRKWLERSSEDVQQLAEKCERLKPVYKSINTDHPEFPTNYTYPDIVKHIRKNLIPLRGEAETIAGEMLRGLDILQDEAYRNGNVNYSKTHKAFAQFILDNLAASTKTNSNETEKITKAVKQLMNSKRPYLEDDVYNYLTDQICLFHKKENNDESETNTKKWWKFWQ